jgi:hypothetical protein
VTRPVAVIIAAGPGVSGSLSRRMAREGYDLALVGHEEQALQPSRRSPPSSRSWARRSATPWPT